MFFDGLSITKMRFLFQLLLTFFLFDDSRSLDIPIAIQVEEFEPKYISKSPKLSMASIWIDHSKKVHWCFCTTTELSVQIVNIDYTNDGDNDTVSVFVDETRAGTFMTYAKSRDTQEWEMFLSSGYLDFDKGFIKLDKGHHNVTIELTEGNSKQLELNRIDLIVRSSIPRATIFFNKGCQAENCFAELFKDRQSQNISSFKGKKRREISSIIPKIKRFTQIPDHDYSVQMSPTSQGASFTYRQHGKANLSQECDGCFLTMQKRKSNPCSKEEKVKMELYTKSPRAYRIRMSDESVQLCNKSKFFLFSVGPKNNSCDSSSAINDEKWLFYSVSKPSATFPNVINPSLDTTYIITYTMEKYEMLMYAEYDCIKLTISLSNLIGHNESISITASLNWDSQKDHTREFTRSQPNQSWVFNFKKLIPDVNFIVLNFRGKSTPRRVCLDSISLEVFSAPPIKNILFRKNEVEILGSTETGKSIPKMDVLIMGRRLKRFPALHALKFSVFSHTSNEFTPLIVLTASRKLYLQTQSRNPDYSTSSYFEIGHRVPVSTAVHFTISSVYVNPLNQEWEVIFSDDSRINLRLFYSKDMTDVVISKQNYFGSIPNSAFRLLPIIVFQAKWPHDYSCGLYSVNNKTKFYYKPSATESDKPPVIGWRQVYAKRFTIYGASKPSPTSTYTRPPRFIVESLDPDCLPDF